MNGAPRPRAVHEGASSRGWWHLATEPQPPHNEPRPRPPSPRRAPHAPPTPADPRPAAPPTRPTLPLLVGAEAQPVSHADVTHHPDPPSLGNRTHCRPATGPASAKCHPRPGTAVSTMNRNRTSAPQFAANELLTKLWRMATDPAYEVDAARASIVIRAYAEDPVRPQRPLCLGLGPGPARGGSSSLPARTTVVGRLGVKPAVRLPNVSFRIHRSESRDGTRDSSLGKVGTLQSLRITIADDQAVPTPRVVQHGGRTAVRLGFGWQVGWQPCVRSRRKTL